MSEWRTAWRNTRHWLASVLIGWALEIGRDDPAVIAAVQTYVRVAR